MVSECSFIRVDLFLGTIGPVQMAAAMNIDSIVVIPPPETQ